MGLSPSQKLNIEKVLIISASYTLISVFIAFFNNEMLVSQFSLGPANDYHFKSYLLVSVLIGLVAGILGGAVLVTVNSGLFRKRSFSFALLSTGVSYIIVFVIVTFFHAAFLTLFQYGTSFEFIQYFELLKSLFLDGTLITNFILWWVITLFTLFLLQVNDKFGPGILFKFLKGNYYQPREEQRIFLFADMKSSTTIAETIGNEKYFNLLSDMFSDITNTILDNEGEIYQYVGDEIVISWPLKKGIRKANSLRCFIQIQKRLKELAADYINKYGVNPVLKAGLHHGEVMAGEIGVIKKDIIYSGDVLNTTSRIQEQCNKYKVDFLISRETMALFDDSEFQTVPLGSIELRGKEQIVELHTVSETV